MLDNKAGSTQNTEVKPRILVADDSKIVRVTARRMLAEKFDLVFAEDGEQAWKKLCEDKTIQVLFTDLGMPNLTGYELTSRVRESSDKRIRELAVIVITGAADDELVKRMALESGATDFITKPFKATELIARADSHVNYRRDKVNLEKSIDIDLLTGTLNKNGLNEQLERDVSFVNRHNENLALITFELDNFNSIVDKIKKPAAEQIIKHIANILIKTIRKEDSIARLDFAKFLTVLPMAKKDGVIMLARRLCEKVKTFNFKIAGEVISLTMSVGIATISKGTKAEGADLLEASEKALLNAKALGPGEVQILALEDDSEMECQEEHHEEKENQQKNTISIDELLEAIVQGQNEFTETQLLAAIDRLAPLVSLLNAKQKQQLIG